MLTISLSANEYSEAIELQFEHSLLSLSKWESIHEKAFYGKDAMSPEGTISYIQQMLISPPPPDEWIQRLEVPHFEKISKYINSKQTATWFRETQTPKNTGQVITSELIYSWMVNFQIPFECERWHLNRLMTLIKVCSANQTPPKKMNAKEQAEHYRRLNEQRRKELGTTG